MKKQAVFALVFVILALAISVGVYFGARADTKNRRARQIQEFNPRNQTQNHFQALPRDPNRGAPGEAPVAPPRDPTENIQRTLKTLEEVRRINRMNQDMNRRRESQPPTPPPASPDPSR